MAQDADEARIPDMFRYPTINIVKPGGASQLVTVTNPLYCYKFHDMSILKTADKRLRSLATWNRTYRWPIEVKSISIRGCVEKYEEYDM